MPDPQHTLRLPEDLWAAIEAQAQQEGLSPSKWLRKWLPVLVALAKLAPSTR